MSSREDFEKAVLKLMPFADVVWSEVYQEYTVPGIQSRWKGYQMRQPEIDALKDDIAQLKVEPVAESFAKSLVGVCPVCKNDAGFWGRAASRQTTALRIEKTQSDELRKAAEERDELVRLFVKWWLNNDLDSNSHYFNQIMKSSPSVVAALEKK